MNIFEFMAKDHDRLDKIFVDFRGQKEIENARPLFHEFKTGLQRHIIWEEDILFPIFESKTGMYDAGPTAVMRMEHRQIKDYLERIHTKVRNAEKGIEGLASGLVAVLTDHNNKEENILYPWIDQSLTEKELKEVFTKMENIPPERYNKCC